MSLRDHKLWRDQVTDRFILPADPAIYPGLDLSSDVLRRPMWSGDLPRKRSGFQARIGYWEWELSYSPTADAFSQLGEFFAAHDGPRAFLYHDPDDHHVKGQYLATGDGTTRRFRLVHKIGGADGDDIVVVEPIACLDPTQPFELYIDVPHLWFAISSGR